MISATLGCDRRNSHDSGVSPLSQNSGLAHMLSRMLAALNPPAAAWLWRAKGSSSPAWKAAITVSRSAYSARSYSPSPIGIKKLG